MDFELISFKLCPYVQRSVITLLHKQVPYRITYIDIADPPPWFLEISPFGQVPVLRVDNAAVIFESAVINEFIDEVTPGSLHPQDAVARALNRSWIEFGSACLVDNFNLIGAKSAEAFEEKRDDLIEKLDRLEGYVGGGPYFNGKHFSLVDAAYAPLFMRLSILARDIPVLDQREHPKLSAWSAGLLGLPEVRDSVVPELPQMYRNMVRARKGHAAELLAE